VDVICLAIAFTIIIGILYIHQRNKSTTTLLTKPAYYNEVFLLTLIELLPEPVYFKDADGTVLLCNEALEQFLNLKKEEIIGKNAFTIIPLEDTDTYKDNEKLLLKAEGPRWVNYEGVRIINGRKHYAIVRKRAIRDNYGKPLGIVGVIIDITELKQAQERLTSEKNRLNLALEIGNIAYWEQDLRTNKIYLSESGLQLLGYDTSIDSIYLDQFVGLIHPDDREKFLSDLYSGLLRDNIFNLQFRIKRPDGNYLWLESKTKPIETDFDSGEQTKIAGVLVDITRYKNEVLQQKQLISDLYTIATIDNLTGALARWAGEAHIRRYLSKENMDETYSLILLDLDNFKNINDTYGHLMGDAVLSKVGEIVKKSLRTNDLFIRWGGDEFLVFCQNSIDQAIHLAERLRSAIKEQFSSENLPITTSIGLTYAKPRETLEDIFKRADEALHKAKAMNKDQIYVMKPDSIDA